MVLTEKEIAGFVGHREVLLANPERIGILVDTNDVPFGTRIKALLQVVGRES